MIERNIKRFALDVLHSYSKMLLISGPRQSGKTTFAKQILKNQPQGLYVNWDIFTDQKRIIQEPYFFQNENRDLNNKYLVVFDEIHKYKKWKNYLKGCYDGFGSEFNFMVTGSGRLDLFKKGGDSLFGRYFAIKLFPFTIGELIYPDIDFERFVSRLHHGFESDNCFEIYQKIYTYSGFPEPYIKATNNFYSIWSNERKQTLIRQDIRDAYAIKDISNIEILVALLPSKVGSPLSINSLREDVGAAFDSVKKWLLILEQFYYVFFIRPYSKNLSRSIKKEPKMYLYDWAEVIDEAARFENVVAFHLYKTVHLWNDTGKGRFELYYIRDKEGREVDFMVTKNNTPLFMVECKYSDDEISKNLVYFQLKTRTPFAIQVVHSHGISKKFKYNGFVQYILSADRFLQYLC